MSPEDYPKLLHDLMQDSPKLLSSVFAQLIFTP